jgi:hypothetical protein
MEGSETTPEALPDNVGNETKEDSGVTSASSSDQSVPPSAPVYEEAPIPESSSTSSTSNHEASTEAAESSSSSSSSSSSLESKDETNRKEDEEDASSYNNNNSSSSSSVTNGTVFVGSRSGLLISVQYASSSSSNSENTGGSFQTLSGKPYMGGLREKNSGVIFHHAVVQAAPPPVSKWANAPPRFSRDTQTPKPVTKSQQVKREGGAQTTRRDIHHDKAYERVVTVKPYFTSEMNHEKKTEKAIEIQTTWRSALARKQASELRHERALAAAELEAEATRQYEANRAQQQADLARRMNPRSKEDFAILYDEVEAWRVAETNRINESYPHTYLPDHTPDPHGPNAAARRAAHVALQAKECELVATIERLRLVAAKESNELRAGTLLTKMSNPKPQPLTGKLLGDTVIVETPFTKRALELKELFQAISLPPSAQSSDQRLDAILNVKFTVKEFTGALIDEIATLIDREADLLSRGRPQSSMEGLRTRMKSLFSTFCEDPAYNPGAAHFGKKTTTDRKPSMLPSFLKPGKDKIDIAPVFSVGGTHREIKGMK